MARSWDGRSSGLQAGRGSLVAPGWDGGSTTDLGWDGRSWGAADCNELKSSKSSKGRDRGSSVVLDWGEMTSSTPSWNRGSSAALGCEALRSSRWSGAVPVSRGWRELGSSGLRRRELGDTRMRSKLGGSRLRGKEHCLSRPGMRKLGCSRL